MGKTPIELTAIDHLVLTVADIEASCSFYENVLCMRRETFGKGRVALHFGRHKLNLHPRPSPIEPRASLAEPGTIDICFVSTTPVESVVAHLKSCGVAIELGPVGTNGANGPMRSVYFRDLDGNLVEVSNYPGRQS